MMKFFDIEFTIDDRCARITLNIPASHNALTFRAIAELKTAIAACHAIPELALLILSGNGPSFCSGDNLKGMGEIPYSGDLLAALQNDWYHIVARALRELPIPVVVLAHGNVLGAGLELLMAADIKVVTREARLGLPFARLGTAAMNYHLPRQIGFTRAARMLFTGDMIDGRMAVDWGLATEAVEDHNSLVARSEEWAVKFRDLSTPAIGRMKETFYQSFELDEKHWYDWWVMQWMAHLERMGRVGAEALTPAPVRAAEMVAGQDEPR